MSAERCQGKPGLSVSETQARPDRSKWERFFKAVNRVPDVLAAICIASMLVSVMIQIITRLIGRPVAWTEEATRYFFIWVIFLGIAAGFRYSESARVTFFINLFPKPFRKRVAPAIYVIVTVGFFLLMLVTGTDLVMQQIKTTEMGSALRIPLWFVGICVPISAALGILGVLEAILLHPETLGMGEDKP